MVLRYVKSLMETITVEVAVITGSHKVLAGSLQREDDTESPLLNWQVIMYHDFIPENSTVNKVLMPLYRRQFAQNVDGQD
jgi:hypothetical protein